MPPVAKVIGAPSHCGGVRTDIMSPISLYVEPVGRGGATVLKVGGTNSASGASRKFFLTPPLFSQWGDKILLR